jgi:hypothetical protein
MKYDQIQPLLRASNDAEIVTIGKYGCYFLSLLQTGKLVLAHDYETVLKNLYRRYQYRKWMDGECTILDGPAILQDLGGDRWEVCKVDIPRGPPPPAGENTEIIYRYKAFSGDGYHFRTPWCDTEIERERLLAGYRVYTRMA